MSYKDIKFSELDDELFSNSTEEDEIAIFEDEYGNKISYPLDYLEPTLMENLIKLAENDKIKTLEDINKAIKEHKDKDKHFNN